MTLSVPCDWPLTHPDLQQLHPGLAPGFFLPAANGRDENFALVPPGTAPRTASRMLASVMNTNLLETTMNKLLTVIAATLLADAAIASGAEAGFNVRIKAPAGFSEVHKAGCGGGGGASRVYRRASIPIGSPLQAAGRGRQPHRLQAGRRGQGRDRRPVPSRCEEAGGRRPDRELVDHHRGEGCRGQEPKTEKKVAEKPAKKSEGQKVATAGKDLGCKTFFASVGMTLSRPLRKRQK